MTLETNDYFLVDVYLNNPSDGMCHVISDVVGSDAEELCLWKYHIAFVVAR